MGLGPRVPMIVVSPWTKGGFVNSQVFDHTSVLRLLEARFGVRRAADHALAAGGDRRPDQRVRLRDARTASPPPRLPDASGLPAKAKAQATLPWPKPPTVQPPLPRPGAGPAAGARPALRLRRRRARSTGDGLALTIANTGAAGAGFNLYPAKGEAGPWFYTVEAGKAVSDLLPIGADGYDLTLYGPNGFLRGFRGTTAGAEVEARYDAAGERLELIVRNAGSRPLTVTVANAYAKAPARTHSLAPGARIADPWPIAAAAHWYDLTVTVAEDPGFLRRLAGHIETGSASLSDPALG